MKNEKLDLMLNKVVEFTEKIEVDGKQFLQTNDHFKAFLYKNSDGNYYFKVVEILKGNMAFNDIIELKAGDENFLTIAEKPKLMRITKKSWHYRLMKYVLQGNAPTPKDMQNGCPYFWLVMFSMIVVPFFVIFKAMKWTLLLIPRGIFWGLKELVKSWLAGIDDEVAYDLNYGFNYGKTKMPKTMKIFLKNTNENFYEMYLSEKYGINDWNDPKRIEKTEEIKSKWEIWTENMRIKHDKEYIERAEKISQKYKKRREKEEKYEIVKARWEAKMKPINNILDSISDWLTKTFTVERGHRNMIVKRTKQFIGALITFFILGLTFLVINYFALGLMVAADFCIEYWYIFAIVGGLLIILSIAYGLYILVISVSQSIVDKYRLGKKIWYIEPFIYLLWYPIKYIVLSIVFIFAKILWIPVHFIFYTCIWTVLEWIGVKIGRGVYNLGKIIVGSTGIFGEYFGASYSDYCPGLEWVDFDEEN